MSKFHSLTVKEVSKETPNAVSIVFDIPGNLKSTFEFIAGQYITVKKEINGEELRRAYSICSAPNSGELRIAVKAVIKGLFSVFANTKLKAGDTLEVSGPEGKFVLKTSVTNTNNYLGIAAGSGITPVMGIIKAALSEEPNSTFTLIYGNKTEIDTIFKNEINNLKTSHPDSFNVQYVYSKEQKEGACFGRIDENKINQAAKKRIFHKVFLCGPESLVDSAKETLIKNEIKEESIYFELFTTPVASKNENNEVFEGTCEVTLLIDDEESRFSMDSGETILAAALKEDIDVPYSCQGGICSSCLTKITAGNAIMKKNTILSEEEVKEGFILACQSQPTTEKITIDYDAI